MTKTRNCPICRKKMDSGKQETWPYFPFCSQRCQLIDLGKWFDGQYSIPVDDSTAVEEGHSGNET